MGSPLGVLFANFYMGCLERNVLENYEDPPFIYARYIDDIFVDVRDESHLQRLQEALQGSSCLHFTTELHDNHSLPFLDILVTTGINKFITTVYTKKTNVGMCLNAASECPKRYMKSVINSYVNRAFSHCSDWILFQKEIERFSQVLINNGYRNSDIQCAIKRKLNCFMEEKQNEESNQDNITIYYRNQMTTSYKTDERILREIIKRGISPLNEEEKVNLLIYYRNKKTSEINMRFICVF